MSNDCIFCKIISGDIPSYKIYGDDDFIAILDRFPSSLGHVLILPKMHFASVYDIPEDTSGKVTPLIAKLANALKSATNCDGMNVLQNNGVTAGQTIFHYHVHLIPRYENDDVKIKWTTKDPSPEDFTAFLDKFRKNM